MTRYIATFFSHYDALSFFHFLGDRHAEAKLMPVPRKVGASCGTCVSFICDPEKELSVLEFPFPESAGEIEAIYRETEGGFFKIKRTF